MLTAREIRFVIGNQTILSSVDASIRKGGITILLGPSGAGKTTLLRCLSMLSEPSSGQITIDEQKFSFPQKQGPVPPWPTVTAVFQQHFLWPHLTLRENVMLPLRLTGRGNSSTVEELISVLDLHEFIDRYPRQASLGQRQRVAIARALALHPDYVLFDEITSSLDVEQSFAILRHLLELKHRGIGILLITHHLEFARALLEADPADEFIFLDEGKVVESGNIENLFAPRQARLKNFIDKMGYQIKE